MKAAVRETFEECGVLLAGEGPVGSAPTRARADLVAHRRTLPDVLDGRPLRADLLRAWSRWITPAASPKRYDTAFLVAQVPEGQEADAHTTEAVEARWWHPEEALERWEAGRDPADGSRRSRRCGRSPPTPTAPRCSPPPSSARSSR